MLLPPRDYFEQILCASPSRAQNVPKTKVDRMKRVEIIEARTKV
jgi:hypothetical protein